MDPGIFLYLEDYQDQCLRYIVLFPPQAVLVLMDSYLGLKEIALVGVFLPVTDKNHFVLSFRPYELSTQGFHLHYTIGDPKHAAETLPCSLP